MRMCGSGNGKRLALLMWIAKLRLTFHIPRTSEKKCQGMSEVWKTAVNNQFISRKDFGSTKHCLIDY